MIAMEMGDEDLRHFTDMQATAKELVLSPFATIKQPQARLLCQP